MKTSDFYFDLPEELIAQEPLKDRASSRLMVVHKDSGEREHRHFRDIKEYLRAGDCLVINNTKVLPARLYGERVGTGAAMEILLLVRRDMDTWEVLVRPGKKARPGDKISFGGGKLVAEVLEVIEGGNRIIRFEYEGVFEAILDELGEMPLPPYITHQLQDKNRYQTVYAKYEGTAAAPTAGLHFTEELMERIKAKGVKIAFVTLHVGLGTFRPVSVDNVEEHKMHSEWFNIPDDTLESLQNHKGRIVSLGTTVARTLEYFGKTGKTSGEDDIFIYPGFEFKVVDALITNYHAPKSTVLMLASAFAGWDNLKNAYEHAIDEKYNFLSYGDSMLIC